MGRYILRFKYLVFLFDSLCLLVLLSVSVLFSPSMCLDGIKLSGHLLEGNFSFGLPYVL